MPNGETGSAKTDTAASRLGLPTPIGSIWEEMRRPEPWTDEEREEVLEDLFFTGPEWVPHVRRFTVLLVLSSAIAAFGLISDSAAVVIGAMLVAPLMTPILAVSAAVAYARTDRLLRSVLLLLIGTTGAVLIGWLVAVMGGATLSQAALPAQIVARTSPTLIDLGIAVAAGLAAGYVLTHRRIGGSLPGVAIAVALVPPLATAGVSLHVGTTDMTLGALLLYVTNLVAIVLSAIVVMIASGFVPPHVVALAKGQIKTGLWISGVLLLVVAIPLAIHTVTVIDDDRFAHRVSVAVAEWDPQARIVTLDADKAEELSHVDLVVATAFDPVPAWELSRILATNGDGPVEVNVQYLIETTDVGSAR